MLRLLNRVAKRERNSSINIANKYGKLNNKYGGILSTSYFSTGSSGDKSPDVAVQLDYYMSLQFAGVACALVNGTSCHMMCTFFANHLTPPSHLPTK